MPSTDRSIMSCSATLANDHPRRLGLFADPSQTLRAYRRAASDIILHVEVG